MKATWLLIGVNLFGLTGYVKAQVSSQSAWISGGDELTRLTGNYISKGSFTPDGVPRARMDAVSITRSNGHVCVFSGATQNAMYLNDLWCYDPSTAQWAWLSGDSKLNSLGKYGVQGTASASNVPGARYGAGGAYDSRLDRLYIYSGYGASDSSITYLNDLWMFDFATNQWTWLSGLNPSNKAANLGVYGVQGVPAPANRPGHRANFGMAIDTVGQYIWVFGGSGYGETDFDSMNDLWRFDLRSGLWTWISGANTVAESNTEKVPGARYSHGFDVDSNKQKIYVFAGTGYDVDGVSDKLNDLWVYDITGNSWTLLSGSLSILGKANYGVKGVFSEPNTPGARTDHAAALCDDLFCVFGGSGLDNSTRSGLLSDLWTYDPVKDQWAWVNGPAVANRKSNFGTAGAFSATTLPGSRAEASITFSSADKNLYLFGGQYETMVSGKQQRTIYNELWAIKVQMDSGNTDPDIKPTGGGNTGAANDSSAGKVAGLAGGIIGAVTLIGVSGLVYARRRQNLRKEASSDSVASSAAPTSVKGKNTPSNAV